MDTHLAHPTFIPKRGVGRRVLDQALKTITQGVIVTDSDQIILSVNSAFTDITGYSEAECIGRNCRFLQGPESDPKTVDRIREACMVGASFSGEILNYRKDGTIFWNDLLISALKDAKGKTTNFMGVTRDISERKQIEQALLESEQRLILAIHAGGVGIWDWNILTGEVKRNARWIEMLGENPNQRFFSVEDFKERIHPDDLGAVLEQLGLALDGVHEYRYRYRTIGLDGRQFWVEDKGAVIERSHDGKPLRMVGAINDVTELVLANEKIEELAFYDPLTQVLNRRLFEDRLHQKLVRTQRSQHYGALLFADLDHFKELNDRYGHQAGDLRLIDIAKRMKECVRETDTVARFGGDEFAIILGELGGDQTTAHLQAKKVAEKLCQSLSAASCLKDATHKVCKSIELGKCRCSVSIGVKLFKGSEITQEQLIAQADSAMYQAKKAGGNRVQFYELDTP